VLEHGKPLDYQYYVDNQLRKPLMRIFEPIMAKPEQLLCMHLSPFTFLLYFIYLFIYLFINDITKIINSKPIYLKINFIK
jgi:hypothetical protein